MAHRSSHPAGSRSRRRTLAGIAVLALALVAGTAAGQGPQVHRGPYVASDDRPHGPRFREMPPEQRRQVLRERFEGLPPDEQARIRERIRYEREHSPGGALSPEQRRQLRRDVMEHGREVYGPRPLQPRRE